MYAENYNRMPMKIVMDADCLIKLTKADLKEQVCAVWSVTIPELVRREAVERAPHLPDAVRIRENVEQRQLAVQKVAGAYADREDAALFLFREGGFDVIASDDARFIRRLRGLGVPFAVPAVIAVLLCRDGVLTAVQGREALDALRPHVSADQYATARLLLPGRAAG